MNQTSQSNTASYDASLDTKFFGHPKGLSTLFFTEMWERMSYYGMRGLLVLFMTAALQEGGLGITTATAFAIYGLYTASVYFMGLPGGWLADRLIGSQKAIWYGGIIIMCGHIVLAIPNDKTFFIGLILVVLGTGLLKPNISAVVGQLYSIEDERRDSGYAIYYMGINIGSLIGYTVCGYLAENIGWHWAFGAAAVGMALGLIHFRMTTDTLKGAGAEPVSAMSAAGARKSWSGISLFLVVLTIVTALMLTGSMSINPIALSEAAAYFFCAVFVIYYLGIYFGSSLNIFGRDFTDRTIFGFEFPTTWLQNANPFFIIVLTPFFAAIWINLGKRMVTPAYGIKCAVGLIIMAMGFVVMFFAAQLAAQGLKVAPYWLILTYFLHTVGELCLSPIALSAVSKLSPKRFVGQLMGVFVLTYSMGNIIAGLLAGRFNPEQVDQMPNLFMQIVIFSVGIGAVVLLVGLVSKQWEKDIEDVNQSANA